MAGRESKWYKLDNAAKIIPATEEGADTRVFRLVCELNEEVDPAVLQLALDRAMRVFPHFACHLRRGLFWHYLETTDVRPVVAPDSEPALRPIYHRSRQGLLFRVEYLNRRISLEVYHVLSDGTGAFEFLKEIVRQYLVEKHGLPHETGQTGTGSIQEMEKDAFDRFYKRGVRGNALKNVFGRTSAYQLRGEKDENLNLHLLEGTVSVEGFLNKCREHKATLAVFSTALMIESIIDEMKMRERRKPVVVTVPVNLRNYFPSETTRNFFGVLRIAFRPENYDGNLDSIISEVKAAFADQLSEDKIFHTMNTYSALEHNWAVKVVPLQLKDLGIQGLNFLRVREVTTSVSNVGRIVMPEEFSPYIDRFAGFMSTQRAQMVICSYEDRLVFGVTSIFRRHGVMMNFFRKLSGMGLKVELASNDYDE